MIQTKITNIVSKNGVDGWEQLGDYDALTKTFVFDSFEQGQAFVQHVGKYCEAKDHHPEWTCVDGGKQLQVKLTSHFYGNKVSLNDWELAEHMNLMYSETKSSFKMFPWITEKTLISLSVGVGSFVVVYSMYRYFVLAGYEKKLGNSSRLLSFEKPADIYDPNYMDKDALFLQQGRKLM